MNPNLAFLISHGSTTLTALSNVEGWFVFAKRP
jgi:hypothetical protein